jgi:hypothetical protein
VPRTVTTASLLHRDDQQQRARLADPIPDRGDGAVVDLSERRARRLLDDLGLLPTVEVPCSGCCRCHGWPEGLECRS